MSDMFTEGNPMSEMTTKKSVFDLSPDRLNLVGEVHEVSDKRRRVEKTFVQKVLGEDAGYWVEDKFPDLQWKPTSMSRKRRQGKDGPAADLIVVRGLQTAAELADAFRILCESASKAAGRNYLTRNDATAGLADFMCKAEVFAKILHRLKGTWKATGEFTEAEEAAQKVQDDIFTIFNNYIKMVRIAIKDKDPHKGIEATRTLAGCSGDPIAGMSLTLSRAAFGEDNTDIGNMVEQLQLQRSRSMALAASLAERKGVWKVGDEHINDLKSGKVQVDMSGVTILTADEFEQELRKWQELLIEEVKGPQQLRSVRRQGVILPKDSDT